MKTLLAATLFLVAGCTACKSSSKEAPPNPAGSAAPVTAGSNTATAAGSASAPSTEWMTAEECAAVAPKIAVGLAVSVETRLRAKFSDGADKAAQASLETALAGLPAKMPAFKTAVVEHCTTDEWPKEFGTCLSDNTATEEELLGRCAPKLPDAKGQKLEPLVIAYSS